MNRRKNALRIGSVVMMTMAASPPLIAQRIDGDFRSGPASGRAEVPIRQVQLSNGTTRYAIPISVGGQPVLVGLDTGSVGLRLLPDAQAGLQSTGKANHEPFGSGVVLDGPIARGQIAIGDRSGVIGVQKVLGVHCAKGGNACAAGQGIARYRVMGDGLPGEGFLGIIGIKPNLDAVPRNPLIQLGVQRWIVSLPQPGSGRPGTLVLNPDAHEEAGFRPVPSGRNPGQVLGCLYRPTPRPARACGNTILDTGAPGVGVFNGGMVPQAMSDAPARFVFGTPAARSPGITLRLNERRQMTRYSASDKPGIEGTQLRMGVSPYLAYDILYDADRGTIAVRARPSFPAAPRRNRKDLVGFSAQHSREGSLHEPDKRQFEMRGTSVTIKPDAFCIVDRRNAMVMVAAAGLLPALLRAAPPQDVWPLWPTPPGGGGPAGPIEIDARGAVSNIAVPTITVLRPHRPTGAAMLIAGGGGYKRIEEGKEARPAASWLSARGITAFILRYRLPGEGWADGPLAPLQDAQRALRLIRARAGSLGIDPKRVGVLGFSAGGHLLGLAATRSNFSSYAPIDPIDRQSARPDVAALIYPVVTLEPPYDRTSTRRVLIGAHPGAVASADWSVETHVRAACPPMFLVQAADDPISDPHNTLILRDACERAHIPVELHRLPSGGHGFGMGVAGTPPAQWPQWFEPWLAAHGFSAANADRGGTR